MQTLLYLGCSTGITVWFVRQPAEIMLNIVYWLSAALEASGIDDWMKQTLMCNEVSIVRNRYLKWSKGFTPEASLLHRFMGFPGG
jgi:hypothetical protein